MGDLELQSKTYPSAILQQLHLLYQKQQCCDFSLVLEDGCQFAVHKVALLCASQHLKTALEQGLFHQTSWLLRNTNVDSVRTMLRFIYSGVLCLNSTNIWSVLLLATQLEIPEAIRLCQEFVQTIFTEPLAPEQQCLTTTATDGFVAYNSRPRVEGDEGDNQSNLDNHCLEDTALNTEGSHLGNVVTVEEPGSAAASGAGAAAASALLERQSHNVHEVTNTDIVSLHVPEVKIKKELRSQVGILESVNLVEGHDKVMSSGLPETSQDVLNSACQVDTFIGSMDLDDLFGESHSRMKDSRRVSPGRRRHQSSERHKASASNGRRSRSRNPSGHQAPLKVSPGTAQQEALQQVTRAIKLGIKRSVTKTPSNKTSHSKIGKRGKVKRVRVHNDVTSALQSCLSCSYCGLEFKYSSLLHQHERRHLDSAVLFDASVQRKIAVELLHRQQGCELVCPGSTYRYRYACRLCQRHFEYYSQYVRHRTASHCRPDKCPVCWRSYHSRRLFLVHLMSKHTQRFLRGFDTRNSKRKKPVRCKLCSQVHLHRHTSQSHLKSVHGIVSKRKAPSDNKKNKWICLERECANQDVWFSNQLLLKKHVHAVHPDLQYCCPFCPHNTAVKQVFERHVQQHECFKGQADKMCELCSKIFPKPYHLKVHRFSTHKILDPSLKLLRCAEPDCDYMCVHQERLRQHMRKHQPEKNYSCSICRKLFKTAIAVKKHTKKIHLGIRPYICDKCGANYGEQAELKMHLARHDAEKAFSCQHCDYSTSDKSNLKTHLYSRHSVKMEERMKIFNCNECGYSTNAKYRFTDHMRVHRNMRDIPCPTCDKLFMTRKAMSGHVQKVHKPKNLCCEVCQYKTSETSKLREHMRIMHTHRDLKPYGCAYCNFRSATSGNCRKHVMHRHKDEAVRVVKLAEEEARDRPLDNTSSCETNAEVLMVVGMPSATNSIPAEMVAPSVAMTTMYSVDPSLYPTLLTGSVALPVISTIL